MGPIALRPRWFRFPAALRDGCGKFDRRGHARVLEVSGAEEAQAFFVADGKDDRQP
jgi:hypothetical protein